MYTTYSRSWICAPGPGGFGPCIGPSGSLSISSPPIDPSRRFVLPLIDGRRLGGRCGGRARSDRSVAVVGGFGTTLADDAGGGFGCPVFCSPSELDSRGGGAGVIFRSRRPRNPPCGDTDARLIGGAGVIFRSRRPACSGRFLGIDWFSCCIFFSISDCMSSEKF